MTASMSDSAVSTTVMTTNEWKELLPLWQELQPCVKNVINSVWKQSGKRKSYMLDKEDLESEALLVFCKCKKAYKAEKGAAFYTYFTNALRHELADRLRCGNKTMFSGARELCKRMGRAASAHEGEPLSLHTLKEMYPEEKEITLKGDFEFWKGSRFDLDAPDEDGEDRYDRMEDAACVSPRAAAFYQDWQMLKAALEPQERLILEALQSHGQEGLVSKRLGISRPTFRLRKEALLARLRASEDWRLMCESIA